MSTIITLRGSWGDLRVHRETGFIVEYDDHGRRGWSPEDEGYHDIALIDPRTLIDPSLDTCGEADVLSAGGWTRAGVYFGPMVWVEDAVIDPDGTVWGDWVEVPLLPPPTYRAVAGLHAWAWEDGHQTYADPDAVNVAGWTVYVTYRDRDSDHIVEPEDAFEFDADFHTYAEASAAAEILLERGLASEIREY